MEPITFISGMLIGIGGKWWYDNKWKAPTQGNVTVADTPTVPTTPLVTPAGTRHKGNVTVSDTPTVPTTPLVTPETTRVPGKTSMA
jgi:hypothetical protein